MGNQILTSLRVSADALQIHDNRVITTSLKVAECFGKRHERVISKIRTLHCSPEFTEHNFVFSEYRDTTGRMMPVCEMTKNGFMFLVMGFSGAKAAAIKEAYIAEFDRMADEIEQRKLKAARLGSDTDTLPLQNYQAQSVSIDESEREKYAMLNRMVTAMALKSDPVILPASDLINIAYPCSSMATHWRQLSDMAQTAEDRVKQVLHTANKNAHWMFDSK